jgi:hypothetical protein
VDIFRLINNGSTWANGQLVHDIDTKLWVERYRSAGEFKFTGSPTTDLRAALPVGALISHTNTYDIMIVENHEIVEDKTKDPILTISGRSLASFLEQRVATENHQGFDPPGPTWSSV